MFGKRSTYLEIIIPVLRRPSMCLDIEPVINWNDLFTIPTVTLTLLIVTLMEISGPILSIGSIKMMATNKHLLTTFRSSLLPRTRSSVLKKQGGSKFRGVP